jgi:hypothetical protein
MLSSVSHAVTLVATSTTMMSDLFFWTRRKAMRFPSGDHCGDACSTDSVLSVVSCCGLRPPLSAIHRRRDSPHDAWKASCRPSGEKAGFTAFCTSWRSSPRSRSRTQMSASRS